MDPTGQTDGEEVGSLPSCLLMCAVMMNRGWWWWWLWNRPPGLLWSLSAGWWDYLVRHLPQSIPYGLPRPWHGKGPRGHLELSTLCKDNFFFSFRKYIFRTIEMRLCYHRHFSHHIAHICMEKNIRHYRWNITYFNTILSQHVSQNIVYQFPLLLKNYYKK